jgi:phosphoglycolate phosphatase-like HAD superfamily hydrolase
MVQQRRFESVRFNTYDKEQAIREILRHYQVAPYYAFYVGDTVDGLIQARKTGVTTIAFTGGDTSGESIHTAQPTQVVGSFDEIAYIFERNLTSIPTRRYMPPTL